MHDERAYLSWMCVAQHGGGRGGFGILVNLSFSRRRVFILEKFVSGIGAFHLGQCFAVVRTTLLLVVPEVESDRTFAPLGFPPAISRKERNSAA